MATLKLLTVAVCVAGSDLLVLDAVLTIRRKY
jgi:hypothetical protein